ncbi:MAG: tyrosine-type recombinase/integrase [Candidatus Dadabacteria bacterium]|nr:tyrosine-type recombinase/integrase [Candidatus Dadabacteria bacterium]
MATLYHRYGSWWAIFTINYKQKWVKIGKMSKTSAKTVLKKLEEDYHKKRRGLIEEKPITFKDFSKEYLKYSKANKSANTVERDEICTNNLIPTFGKVYLSRITPLLIEQYKMKRIKEVKPRTVNIELRCFSNMMKKAVQWEMLSESPFRGVKQFTYEKKPPRFLTKEELDLLLSKASNWLRPIIVFMINTGLREGERAALMWKDIDFKEKKITVRSSKVKDFRVIPMNDKVLELLKWLKENYVTPTNKVTKRKATQMEYAFCNEDGSPVIKIAKALKNAAAKAGLEGISPHTLRHTFASHLVMSGVDLRSVQGLLGHKDISTTMVYSHLTKDHLARSVEKLEWL